MWKEFYRVNSNNFTVIFMNYHAGFKGLLQEKSFDTNHNVQMSCEDFLIVVCNTVKLVIVLILSKYRSSIANINMDIDTFYLEKKGVRIKNNTQPLRLLFSLMNESK